MDGTGVESSVLVLDGAFGLWLIAAASIAESRQCFFDMLNFAHVI